MADAAARLAALEEAISSGLLRFTIEGKTQEYRSLTDMLRVRDMLRQEAGVSSAASAPLRTVAAFRRGV